MDSASAEAKRAQGVAEVAGILASELADLARILQAGQARPNPAAERAALRAHEAAAEIVRRCREPGAACPVETYRQALAALQAASVALAYVKQEMAVATGAS